MKCFLKIFGGLILVLPLVLAGYIAYRLVPKELNLPLPASLVTNNTPEGQAPMAAHGMEVTKTHSDKLTLEKFRQIVQSNLAREGDYLLVNYQRQTLGQGIAGHISPLGAYE